MVYGIWEGTPTRSSLAEPCCGNRGCLWQAVCNYQCSDCVISRLLLNTAVYYVESEPCYPFTVACQVKATSGLGIPRVHADKQ